MASLAVLVSKIVASDFEHSKQGQAVMNMRAQDAAACIFGLQQLSSDDIEVRDLVLALAPLLYQSEGRSN